MVGDNEYLFKGNTNEEDTNCIVWSVGLSGIVSGLMLNAMLAILTHKSAMLRVSAHVGI